MTTNFEVNQVVYGVRCGTFVILGFRHIGDMLCADCKAIGPNGELGRGEICMPLNCIQAVARS